MTIKIEKRGAFHRVPNHRIDALIADLREFDNYNGSIRAAWSGDRYAVTHWSTVVFEYERGSRSAWLYESFISQTTSTLLGRIVRNLPDGQAIADCVATMSNENAKRFVRMSRNS